MKLGVITDCFKKSTKESIELAGKMGFDGVQIYAVSGEFCPESLEDKDIFSYRELLMSQGLEVSALCADLGGHGFEIAEDNPERINKTKRIIDLAVKFGTNVVTTHIGVIPEDKTCEKYKTMLSALSECGEYAKGVGVTLAIETGPENACVLFDFVMAAGDGVGVNLDPANFVMVTGQDPVAAVRLLGKKIVHTHLKDGKMLNKSDPVVIYNHFAEGGIEALNVADFFIETPVGEGDVDWESYIATLREVGFDGYLTIERETGEDPISDIAKAQNFVKERGYV